MKKRHHFFYKVLYPIGYLVIKFKTNFVPQKLEKMDKNYIIVANHTTNIDPIMVGYQFAKAMNKPLAFVGSEHIFRKKLLSKLLLTAFDIIPRQKGKQGVTTVTEMLRRTKHGESICIFPEGNTSFSGETLEILPTIGKLVQKSGASLITYKFQGGYFYTPRWAYHPRKATVYGNVMHEISAEELKNMSAEEIQKIIEEDIYENAYETQNEKRYLYKGKNLAEGIENVFYLCPKCQKIGTISSKGDDFYCECGLHGKYDEYGYISGEGFDFTTVYQWDKWQNERIKSIVADATGVICSDENVILNKINFDHSIHTIAKGTLSIDKERLCVNDTSFDLKNILDVALIGSGTILFSCVDSTYYEIKRKKPLYCGYKYLKIYNSRKEQM